MEIIPHGVVIGNDENINWITGLFSSPFILSSSFVLSITLTSRFSVSASSSLFFFLSCSLRRLSSVMSLLMSTVPKIIINTIL